MEVYGELFTKLMAPFFEGLASIFKNLGKGLFQMFNILNYVEVIQKYKDSMHGLGLVICIFSILFLIVIVGIIIFLIVKAIRTYIKYRRNVRKEDQLIEEIENLNNDILKLKRQNEKISQLTDENGNLVYDKDGKVQNALKDGESRFFKLTKVDEKYQDYVPEEIVNNYTLNQLCEQFRNYSASKLGLYYDIKLIRLFIA